MVKDFNENMVESFGENFKHLNNGIDNLINWQENYKKLVTDEISLINESGSKIKQVVLSLEKMEEGYSKFVKTTEDIIKTCNSVEDINKKTLEAVNGSLSINKGQSITNEIIKNQFNEMKNVLEISSKHVENNLRNFGEVNDIIKESSIEIKNLSKTAIEEQKELIRSVLETHKKEMDNSVGKVINMLGNDLASLSNKFVEDYTPLTERLREVVSMAEDLKGV